MCVCEYDISLYNLNKICVCVCHSVCTYTCIMHSVKCVYEY